MKRVILSGQETIFLEIQESTEFYFTSKSNSKIKIVLRSLPSCDLFFYFQEHHALADIKILFLSNQDLRARAKIICSGDHNTIRLDVRGIARGNAQVSFDAGVDIAPHAEHTDAYISEKGVIFDKARINFFPNLQIAQNNVKAGHAASIKNYREDDLFYLFSRGLSATQAKTLLLEGFLQEFSDHVALQEILAHAQT